jgi:hypothetical protein
MPLSGAQVLSLMLHWVKDGLNDENNCPCVTSDGVVGHLSHICVCLHMSACLLHVSTCTGLLRTAFSLEHFLNSGNFDVLTWHSCVKNA